MKWSYTPDAIVKGSALVVHGLNLIPERMSPIGETLEQAGFDTLNLDLTGIRDMDKFRHVNLEKWKDDIRSGFKELKTKQRGEKTLIVGFSLGGMLTINQILEGNISADKVVYFAPAISMTKFAHFIENFFFLPSSTRIPSFGPAGYKSHWATPISAYRALFEGAQEVEHLEKSKLEMPGLIIMDPRDQLVSFEGVKAFAKNYQLPWEFFETSTNRGHVSGGNHHIIIDPESIGEKSWLTLKHKIETFVS